jgi:hypothetical protein
MTRASVGDCPGNGQVRVYECPTPMIPDRHPARIVQTSDFPRDADVGNSHQAQIRSCWKA